MPLTFLLLLLAIGAAWLPRPPRPWPPAWAVLYGFALAAAVVQGFVRWPGVAVLLLLAGLAWQAARTHKPLAWGALAVLAAALLLHRVPGFANPLLLDGVRWSPDARPFTQYLNFDKGSAGLLLVALLAPHRPAQRVAWAAAVGLATVVLVLGLALGLGMVRLDPKWSVQLALFLAVNLALTCVAEEAAFRLLLQEPLARRFGVAVAVLASAMLFGLAHAGGGAAMVLLAGLTGLGSALAYALTGRIAAPVLVHFAVNAVHAVGLSYPGLG